MFSLNVRVHCQASVKYRTGSQFIRTIVRNVWGSLTLTRSSQPIAKAIPPLLGTARGTGRLASLREREGQVRGESPGRLSGTRQVALGSRSAARTATRETSAPPPYRRTTAGRKPCNALHHRVGRSATALGSSIWPTSGALASDRHRPSTNVMEKGDRCWIRAETDIDWPAYPRQGGEQAGDFRLDQARCTASLGGRAAR